MDDFEDIKDWKKYIDGINKHNEEFKAKWPHYCKACNGWGGTTYTELHGFRGKGGPGEQIFDPCGALKPETCHRCAQDGLDSDGNGPCKYCGWDYNDGLLAP